MTHSKINSQNIIITFLITLLFAVVFPLIAQAETTTLEIQISDTTPDVCVNIPGIQASVPSGMQVDSGGNCYTPEPPPVIPVTVDLCNNITGVQTELPDGYYRTTLGNCYIQPTPPAPIVDVCSNLEGSQPSIPDGYYLSPSNTCEEIPPPADMCPNIPGPQEEIPNGMKLDNDICFTPAQPSQNTGNNAANRTTQTPPLRNVPEPLQPVAQFFVNLVPEDAKQWLKALPADVAHSFPYYVFVMVAFLALIPILQSIREALFVRQLTILLKRERDIADQKDNFVALASHYLRTPLTLMKSGVDTVVALDETTQDTAQPLQIHLEKLDSDIGTILQNVESNTELKNISQPVVRSEHPSVWRSPWFWGPIVSSITITILANFLLTIVGDKAVSVSNTFFQFLVAATAFSILYLGVRNMHLQKRLREENQSLIDREKAIDDARNTFISSTTTILEEDLEPITQSRTVIEGAPSIRFFDEGYERIKAILEKFLLLGQVQTGVDRNLETFNIHEAVDNLLVTYNAAISAKRITVANMTSATYIKQNRLLFNFVLGSVLDNAIKFNQEGGSIEISAKPNSKMLSIKISDNGIGIDNDKIEQLFKPFSRATSAVEFNYEGLGFSLFLDKIIMDYTGGDITATSSVNEGTELLVSTPIATNASP